jgi:hypothetical protein
VAILTLAVAAVQAVMWRQATQDARSAAQQGAEAAALADASVDEGRVEAGDALTRSLVREPSVTASVEVDPASGVAYAVVRIKASSVRLLGVGFPIQETGRFPMEPR